MIHYEEHSLNQWDTDCLIQHKITLAGYLKMHYSTLFHPQLPPHKVHSIQNLGFGTCNKVYMEFDAPWWDTDCEIIYLLWKDEVCGTSMTHNNSQTLQRAVLSDKMKNDKPFFLSMVNVSCL